MTAKYTSVVLLALLCVAGCASRAPASLTPAGVKLWQANEAVVAIGTMQRAAIGLNGIEVCEPAPCRPLLSDRNTRVVVNAVEVGIKTIQVAPTGWKAAADVALMEMRDNLDAPGHAKFGPYIEAARTILAALPTQQPVPQKE